MKNIYYLIEKRRHCTKTFILILASLFIFFNSFAQAQCEAFVNESYNTVSLREYRLDKIEKGYEPGYEKDLKKGQAVKLVKIYNGYAIVIYKTDTFVINPKYLQSDCLNRVVLQEQKKQDENLNLRLAVIADENRKLLKRFKETQREKGIQQFNKVEYVTIDKITSLKNMFTNKSINLTTHETVELLGYRNDTIYVAYRDEVCYSNLRSFISSKTDSLIHIILVEPEHKIAMEKWKIQQAERIEAKKRRRSTLIAKYGKEAANAIIKGSVYIGMTKEMAKEAWGEPEDVNTTITEYNVYEQWIYENSNYLYFENGNLTAIQN